MKGHIRPALITAIMIIVMIQILFLSPGRLERADHSDDGPTIDPNELVDLTVPEGPFLAPDIPTDLIPEYSIFKFDYISTKAGSREWKLEAERANVYRKDRNLLHAQNVTAWLYDAQGVPTIVTGREARYFLNERHLEVYGDVAHPVKTTFPDGFMVNSDYLRYLPDERRIVIDDHYKNYWAKGIGKQDAEKTITFQSLGLEYRMDESKIELPSQVRFEMLREGKKKKHSTGVSDYTRIDSDQCTIFRDRNLAHFKMKGSAAELKKKKVLIRQPDLKVTSRTVDLNYGDFRDILNYLIANDDVEIFEIHPDKKVIDAEKQPVRYSTSGRAEFDTRPNDIILTLYPQVYQDQDTITGDVIVIHRDTDIVEADYSNAFSEGNPGGKGEEEKKDENRGTAGRK